MYTIVRGADIQFVVPPHYSKHVQGYQRAIMVDNAAGAVHMGVTQNKLEPQGTVNTHFHLYEEAFFILEGAVIFDLDGKPYQLGPGDYGIIQVGVPHSWRAIGDSGVKWYEMLSPQPKPEQGRRDTYFVKNGTPPTSGTILDLGDPRTRFLGHFDESQLPTPGKMQMDGDRGGNIHGISLKMLIDHTLGAQHLTLFMVEFEPGGEGVSHEHPFEESYFFLNGAAEGKFDGKTTQLSAGDFVWAGVGAEHGLFNRSTAPFRFIETQSPQPPAQQAFLFHQAWDEIASRLDILED